MDRLIRNAEIFQAGNWPGAGAKDIVFTENDLDSIVTSFNALSLAGRVPLKLGHDGADVRTSDSAPALGWVEAVRREGSKLLADIRLTSDKLAEGIAAGAYKFVSVELLRNVQANTRQIPWVLDAVALLGATAPAVGTLKDLTASMQSFRRAGGNRLRGQRLAFKRDNTNPNGDRKQMEKPEVDALIADAVNKATDALTAKFSADVSALNKVVADAEAGRKKAVAAAHRTAVMAPIEAAVLDNRINGAAKEQFLKRFSVADDEKVMAVTVAEAEAAVKDYEQMPSMKGPGSNKRKQVADNAVGPAKFAGKQCGDVVSALIEERMIERHEDLSDFAAREAAQTFVFRTHKDLAKQYFADPQAAYEHDNQAAA